jgi:hypothetical protein
MPYGTVGTIRRVKEGINHDVDLTQSMDRALGRPWRLIVLGVHGAAQESETGNDPTGSTDCFKPPSDNRRLAAPSSAGSARASSSVGNARHPCGSKRDTRAWGGTGCAENGGGFAKATHLLILPMRKPKFLLLLFLSMAATLSASVPLPMISADLSPDPGAAAQGVNAIGDLQNAVGDLLNQTAGPMMALGWIFWGFFTIRNISVSLSRGVMSSLSHLHHFHPFALLIPFFLVMLRVTIAAQMLLWYAVPIPGFGVTFPQLLPHWAQTLSNVIDISSLTMVITEINKVLHMPVPSAWNLLLVLSYYFILGIMSLAETAMLLIDALSYLFVGMLIFCGPPFVASFIDFKWDKLFWDWMGDLTVYSLYQVFASILIAVFGGLYVRFFSNIMGGVYTLGGMMAQIPYLLMITCTFVVAMFMIPSFTSRRFSGFGALGQEWSNSLQRWAVTALTSI